MNILHGRAYGDGRIVRDWLRVSDHCRDIELISLKAVPGESYDIGGESECENFELVQLVCRIAEETFSAGLPLRLR
jgi:dTDP-glucose 4,6-dehydratase